MKSLIRLFFGTAIVLLTVAAMAFIPKPNSKIYASAYENVLGTSMEIKILSAKEALATKAEEAAMKEIDRLNKILSGYDANSEFSHWMQSGGKAVVVSPELFEVLSLFEQWKIKTNGALDASAETISKVWKQAAKENHLPSDAQMKNAVMQVQQQHYILNEANHTAQRLTNAPLILNSFAKSYIMNKAADVALSVKGAEAVVLNIGGDIVIRGAHTEQVLIADPKADAENDLPIAKVNVQNKTIATSGNYRRGVSIDGKWYSHIVDPRTGKAADEVISATVIADNSVDAGALATALNVLNKEEAQQLASGVKGAEYLIITKEGVEIKSKGWDAAAMPLVAKQNTIVNADNKQKTWDPKYELAINVELATVEGMRVHRPFVAVWIMDGNKKPLRQLAVWFNKPKWLPDLRSWYAAYGDTFTAGSNASVSSTSSATRAPGKYTLKWDGKDDAGNLVPDGKYTINVEAAREHGTHQFMTQEIDVKKQTQWSIAGNIEVASVSLEYRKK